MNAITEPGKRRKHPPTVARAEFLLTRGDARAAVHCARSILKSDRAQIGALEVLAKGLWQLARYDQLLVTLDTLVRLNPYEPGYHALRGAVYQALGRIGDAIKSFARAENSDVSAAAVEELREWQGLVIADLIESDIVFRTHYAQDPEAACRARGFEFLPNFKPEESWFTKPEAQSLVFTRPS